MYLASGTVGSRWPAFLGSSFYHAGIILVKFFSCDGKMGINGFKLMTPPAEQPHCKDVCSFPQIFEVHSGEALLTYSTTPVEVGGGEEVGGK